MDPLSFTASLVTVIGTIKQVRKGLKQLKGLQQAPRELDDLLDENSRFEAILKAVGNAPRSSSSVKPELNIILSKARENLIEFDALIQYTLTEAGTSRKVDRLQWVRKEAEVAKLRSNLKDITLQIVALIGVETSTTVNQILSGQQETENQLATIAAAVNHLTRTFDEDRSLQSALTGLLGQQFRQVTLESDSELSIAGTQHPDRVALGPRKTKRSGETLSDFHVHRRRTVGICPQDCRCKCHRGTNLGVPRLPRTFGRVYGESFGVSLLGSRCNNRLCRAPCAPHIKITYILPSWIALRMILIRYSASALSGPELLFMVGRVVSWDNDGLRAIRNRNLDLFKRAMANGSCTPYDIDEKGKSLLEMAVESGEPEIMLHLTAVGVHSQTPIMGKSSSRSFGQLLWENYIALGYDNRFDLEYAIARRLYGSRSATMAQLLQSVEFDEESEYQDFTTLHKIVCGLDFRDLDSEAELHPHYINKVDIYGRSALWYSVIYEAPHFVHCLLKRGADLNLGGNSVIAEAIRCGSPRILELLITSGTRSRDSNFEDIRTAWGLSSCGFWGLGAQEDQRRCSSIELLMIKHLVDVNWQSRNGTTMLMDMCHWMRPCASRIEQLIRYGADPEIRDEEGWTALLHTFLGPNAEAFRTLVRAGARLDVRTHSGFTILHTAVLLALNLSDNINIVEAMRDVDLRGLDLDARDEDGCTAFDLLKKRNGISWESYCEGKRRAIGSLRIMLPVQRHHHEVDIIRSLESLFHHIQNSQGIPLEQQYPPLAEYLCEKTDEDVVPGAWPV